MAAKTKEKLYTVRGSEIHGRGLYAAKPIPFDTWIVEYVGEKVDKDESDRRANVLLDKTKESGGARVYNFVLNDKWDIDGDVEWNDARLINHSCEPNIEAQIWKDKEIWFIALRDIAEGEELVYNYGFDLEHWKEHPCRCGAPRCIGYIADEDLWPQLRRKISARKAAATRKKSAKRKPVRASAGAR